MVAQAPRRKVPAKPYRVGRVELLAWLNDMVQTEYIRIEELSDGIAFLCVLDALDPEGGVPLHRLYFEPRSEVDRSKNLALMNGHLPIGFPYESVDDVSLARGKFQDNYQLLQWLYTWVKCMAPEKEFGYRGFERRQEAAERGRSWVPPNVTRHAAPSPRLQGRLYDAPESISGSPRGGKSQSRLMHGRIQGLSSHNTMEHRESARISSDRAGMVQSESSRPSTAPSGARPPLSHRTPEGKGVPGSGVPPRPSPSRSPERPIRPPRDSFPAARSSARRSGGRRSSIDGEGPLERSAIAAWRREQMDGTIQEAQAELQRTIRELETELGRRMEVQLGWKPDPHAEEYTNFHADRLREVELICEHALNRTMDQSTEETRFAKRVIALVRDKPEYLASPSPSSGGAVMTSPEV